MEVLPSPKFQFQEVMAPLEDTDMSVNITVLFTQVFEAVKAAVGSSSITTCRVVVSEQPLLEVTVSITL